MNDQLEETKNSIQELSEQLYIYITQISPAGFDWVLHIFAKLTILITVFLVIDLIFKAIINFTFRFFHNEINIPL
jgi:hypothetical protein